MMFMESTQQKKQHCNNDDSGDDQMDSTQQAQISCLLCEQKCEVEHLHDHVKDHMDQMTHPYQCDLCGQSFSRSGFLVAHCHEKNHLPVNLEQRKQFKYADIIGRMILNDSLSAWTQKDHSAILKFRESAIGSAGPVDLSETEEVNKEAVERKKCHGSSVGYQERCRSSSGHQERHSSSNEQQTENGKKEENSCSAPSSPSDEFLSSPLSQRRKCMVCGDLVAERTVDQFKHIAYKHLPPQVYLSCPYCTKKAKNFHRLTSHVRKNHRGKKLSILTLNEKPLFRCKLRYCFPRRGTKPKPKLSLDASRQSFSGMEKSPVNRVTNMKPARTSTVNQMDVGSGLDTCSVCNSPTGMPYSAKRNHILEKHLQNVSPQTDQKTRETAVARNLLLCFPKMPVCRECKKVITSDTGRKVHTANQHMRKGLSCTLCSFVVFHIDHLNAHMKKVHSGSKVQAPEWWKAELKAKLAHCFPGFYRTYPSPLSEQSSVSQEQHLNSSLLKSGERGTAGKSQGPEEHPLDSQSSTWLHSESTVDLCSSLAENPSEIHRCTLQSPQEKEETFHWLEMSAQSNDSDDDIAVIQVLPPRISQTPSDSRSNVASASVVDSKSEVVRKTSIPPSSRSQYFLKSSDPSIPAVRSPLPPSLTVHLDGEGGTSNSEEVKYVRCKQCNQKFNELEGPKMEAHVWLKHVCPKQPPYGCFKCSFHTYVMGELRKHWGLTHNGDMRKFQPRKKVSAEDYEKYDEQCKACFNRLYY